MPRYEEVPDSFKIETIQVLEQFFPELRTVKIKLLFDTKKNFHGGKLVLGKCQKPNDLIKYFSVKESNNEEGYQVVVTFDKFACQFASEADRVRLIRHELRHIQYDPDTGAITLLPHDFEDFIAEVELNKDDPDWGTRVATAAIRQYLIQG